MIKFYRGLRVNYSVDTHGQGIYFATDTLEIIHNGYSYSGVLEVEKSVKDISLVEGVLTVTYTDNSTQTIEVGSGKYISGIEDKTLTMPNAVGGIAKGTKVSDLENKTYDQIFDDLLFPTINPTFTAPTATIKFNNYTATQEVGSDAPTVNNFTTTFNAGAINLNGVKQNNRAGALDKTNSYIYYGEDTINIELPMTVSLGETSYQYHVEYAEGPQPKTNKGTDYSTPLAAGSVNSTAVKVNGTYPWFASTSTADVDNPVVKQPLVAWNTTVGAMSTGNFELQPSGTLSQVFKLPRQLKTLQMLNTVSNVMETIGTSEYTETNESININGTDVTYYTYTYNGATRGVVTLLAKF